MPSSDMTSQCGRGSFLPNITTSLNLLCLYNNIFYKDVKSYFGGFSLSQDMNIKATNAKQNNKNISPVHSIILYRTEPISFWNVHSFLPNVQISHILFRELQFPKVDPSNLLHTFDEEKAIHLSIYFLF